MGKTTTTTKIVKTKAKKGRRQRKTANVPDVASCSESLDVRDGTTNTMYGPNQIQLSQFVRASTIAQGYQEYCITNVKWTFKPQFDTFVANTDASSALRIPYLYYMKDKTGSLSTNQSIASLRAMGAKPHRFDDKSIIVSYAPGVLTAVQSAPGTGPVDNNASMKKTSPWLSTTQFPNSPAGWSPSQVNHYGLYFHLDADSLPGDGAYEYGVELEVQFKFRKPLIDAQLANRPAQSIHIVKA